MIDRELHEMLQPIVSQYGVERVERVLGRMKHQSKGLTRGADASKNSAVEGRKKQSRSCKKTRLTAPRYIEKLELAAENHRLLMQLANKFEQKEFLPTIGEVRNFCVVNGIEAPGGSARASVVTRVFGFLATLAVEDIREILVSAAYSGPSRLGPIADAIRRNRILKLEDGQNLRPMDALSVHESRAESSEVGKPSIPSKI